MKNRYMKTFCLWMAFICFALVQSSAFAQTKSSKELKSIYHSYCSKGTGHPVADALARRQMARTMAPVNKSAEMSVMRAASGNEAFCYLLSEYGGEVSNCGIYSISLSNPGAMELVHASELNVSSGTYVNGKVYLQTYFFTEPIALHTKDDITGEEKEIAQYKIGDPVFLDMAFDENTNTLYAIGGPSDAEVLSLYRINLENGAYEKCFDLYSYFSTLAINKEGRMFGIDEGGYLCEIFLDEGYSMEIGFTGEFPMYVQSMAFDPTDDSLYWAAYTDAGSFFAKVNTETGELEKLSEPLGNNAEVAALYFRSDPKALEKPLAPTEAKAVAAGEGALSATISWKNPSEMINGEPLSSLTQVEIYRNGEKVHTETAQLALGASVSWTDSPAEDGLYTYTLLPYNENGAGLPAELPAVFVGRDVPGYVTSLQATQASGSYDITVSWAAPQTGKHGGWFDSNVTYDVVRYPEKKVMAEGITDLTFTDRTITETKGYSYGIVAKNADGVGDTLRTNSLIVGPALNPPFANTMRTEEERAMWVIEDTNKDACTWHYGSNFAGTDDWYLEYYCENTELAADDWFFSAPIQLEAGKHYTLSYDVRLGGTLSKEKFRVVLCDGASSENQVQEVDNRTDFDSNFLLEKASVSFVPETSGAYNLGFQCYSDINQYFVQITNVELKEVAEVDLRCDQIYGMHTAVAGQENRYDVYVTNTGATALDNFLVEVLDGDNEVVGTVNVKNYNLDVEATVIVPVECQLKKAVESTQLTGRVVVDGDEVADNNTAVIADVEVLPGETYTMVQTGDLRDNRVAGYVPFNLNDMYSASQMLYTQDMLGFGAGKIERIGMYYVVSRLEYAKDIDFKIYLTNTEETSLFSWIPENEFTQVFDGKFSLDEHNNTLVIEFDKPFEYTGKGLGITFVAEGGNSNYYYNWFFSSLKSNTVASLSYSGDEAFDFTQVGVDSESYTDLAFFVNNAGVGSVAAAEKAALDAYLAGDQLYISGEYDRLTVYGIDGTKLYVSEEPQTMVDMSEYADGAYIVVLDNGGSQTVKKVMLNR